MAFTHFELIHVIIHNCSGDHCGPFLTSCVQCKVVVYNVTCNVNKIGVQCKIVGFLYCNVPGHQEKDDIVQVSARPEVLSQQTDRVLDRRMNSEL